MRILFFLFLYCTFSVSALANNNIRQCIDNYLTLESTCIANFQGSGLLSQCTQTAITYKNSCLAGNTITEIALSLKPAEVSVHSLAELGLPEDTAIIKQPITDLDDGFPEFYIKDGLLVIATPGDTGKDQKFIFDLSSSSSSIFITLTVNSTRSLEITTISSADEDGNPAPEAPALTINGLSENNVIGASDLSLSIDIPNPLSEKHSKFVISDRDGNIIADISDAFILGEDKNRFTATAEALSSVIENLPSENLLSGDFIFSTNLVSEDFAFAENYSFIFLKPAATITGQLVDASGAPLSGNNIDDLNVAIHGLDSDIRQVASVDKNGQFSFTGLIYDYYGLVITDLKQPRFFNSAINIVPEFIDIDILPETTDVEMEIVYVPLITDSVQLTQSTSFSLTQEPSYEPSFLTNSGGFQQGQDGGTAVYHCAGGNRCNISHTPSPSGSPDGVMVEVELDVPWDYPPTACEYFVHTHTCRPTSWPRFYLKASNAASGGKSSFWGSKYLRYGSKRIKISEKGCVKFKKDELGNIISSPPLTIEGVLSAGWSYFTPGITLNFNEFFMTDATKHYARQDYPIDITAKFTIGCGELNITEAKILPPTYWAPYHVIKPLNTKNNLEGHYLSIPINPPDGPSDPGNNLPRNHQIGFPFEIKYVPSDAEITELKLAIIRGGEPIAETESIFAIHNFPKCGGNSSQGDHCYGNGVINLPYYILHQFLSPTGGPTTIGDVCGNPSSCPDVILSAKLKGTIVNENGETKSVETDYGGTNLKFGGETTTFTPLFLAEDNVIDGNERRYGQVEDEFGDDNWALTSTINWLNTRGSGYFFNDISAQHVAQNPGGRSFLDHSGHSDGSQIDFRYLDHNGDFTSAGFKEENLKLVGDARREYLEFLAGGTKTVAQFKLASWIKFNRKAIEIASVDARRIYVANGPIGRALVDGIYEDGNKILGLRPPPLTPGIDPDNPIGEWTTKPEEVWQANNHEHHWHISLKK